MKDSPPAHFRPSPILPVVPLGLLRSPLFAVGDPDEHGTIVYIYKRPMPMAAQRGEKLAYRGPPLNQRHALAWQAVLLAAEGMDAMDGRAFEVSPDFLLRLMGGRGGDRSQRERLTNLMMDLMRARIHYTTRLSKYAGPLLANLRITIKPRGRFVLELDPNLREILRNEVLRNDLARKARLVSNTLALWLNDYLATHLRPPPEAVERLRILSGSRLNLAQFRIRLRAAVEVLKSGQDPLIISGGIDLFDRLVIEQKAPTRVVILAATDAPARKPRQAFAKPRMKAETKPIPAPNPLFL